MTLDNFQRALSFFGYKPEDKKSLALRMVLVEGATQTHASLATGYPQSRISVAVRRVRHDLDRVKALTGVDVCE